MKIDSRETDLVGKDMKVHNENGGILLITPFVKYSTTYTVTVLVGLSVPPYFESLL